jgi:hypothetical protein
MGQHLWWENMFVIYICCWALPAQYFLGLSPARFMTIFYCLSVESPNLRARSPPPPGNWFPFCCLLWLAGLRWRYSNPPPHGRLICHIQSSLHNSGRPQRKTLPVEFFHYWLPCKRLVVSSENCQMLIVHIHGNISDFPVPSSDRSIILAFNQNTSQYF